MYVCPAVSLRVSTYLNARPRRIFSSAITGSTETEGTQSINKKYSKTLYNDGQIENETLVTNLKLTVDCIGTLYQL